MRVSLLTYYKGQFFKNVGFLYWNCAQIPELPCKMSVFCKFADTFQPNNKREVSFCNIVKIQFNTFAFPLYFGGPTITFADHDVKEGTRTERLLLSYRLNRRFYIVRVWDEVCGERTPISSGCLGFCGGWTCFKRPAVLCFISLNIFQVFALTAGGTLLRNKDSEWPPGGHYAWMHAREIRCWLFDHVHVVLRSRERLSRGHGQSGAGGNRQRRKLQIYLQRWKLSHYSIIIITGIIHFIYGA